MLDTASLINRLSESRTRTLDLIAPYTDGEMEAVHDPIMSPLVWDLAHIAAYEDLWVVHRIGERSLLHPELAAMYDAFETPRKVRGSLDLLNTPQAISYLEEVREQTLQIVAENRSTSNDFLFEMVIRHEAQHTETMLQTIELAHLSKAPGIRASADSRTQLRRSDTHLHTSLSQPNGDSTRNSELHGSPTQSDSAPIHLSGLESVEVPTGRCTIGATGDDFCYDNERPAHAVEVAAFRIGVTPIKNDEFLDFVESGGYNRSELWSPEGWLWREKADASHPSGWRRNSDGWVQWRPDGWVALDPQDPVVHVSWYEADAFARAQGARLPTELEWEKAATWDPVAHAARRFPWGDDPLLPDESRANLDQTHFGPTSPAEHREGASPYGAVSMIGDVWEWTASAFTGYPGFKPFPYREYSEVFFDQGYKVLRGGSWATHAQVATPIFRNWDLPKRRQIFAGFRLAWDVN